MKHGRSSAPVGTSALLHRMKTPMSTAATKRYTVAEYLALERASETKHEFLEGRFWPLDVECDAKQKAT